VSVRPLILLDIDGCIIPNVTEVEDLPSTWSDWTWSRTAIGYYSPTMLTRLFALSSDADFEWASSWGEEALELASQIGAPNLPLAVSKHKETEVVERVKNHLSDRRLIIHIDDSADVLKLTRGTGANVYRVRPTTHIGLTDADIDKISKAIAFGMNA
jgi:hypothetical protein